MLKCKIKKGRPARFKTKGTIGELANETCIIVNQVYAGIKKQNPAAAEAYKHRLLICLLDPDSPVWKEGTP